MSTVRSRVKYSKLDSDDVDLEDDGKAGATSKSVRRVRKKRPPGRWAVPLPKEEEYDDEQFDDQVPIDLPKKSIIVAVVLFVLGGIMLTFGSLMLAGVIGQGQGNFRASPLMVLGAIIFIPGAYNVRTAYYAWRGYAGYSYADIAGFGEGH